MPSMLLMLSFRYQTFNSAKSNTKKINFELSMNYVEWIKTTGMAKFRAR